MAKIRQDLRLELGWTEEGFTEWLGKRHYKGTKRPMTEMNSSGDAVAVIELLKGVLARTRKAQERKEMAT